jgi:arylsulfatase A-like enzyme
MAPRFTSGGFGSNANLLGYLLHRIATLILTTCTIILSIDANKQAYSSEKRSVPNILLILADDLGYADVGFQGCKDIPTPHLDALAAAGVRLTNGYVSGPYCSPTRAGLMTGRYQTRFGHEFNPGSGNGLPLSETTIADRLTAAGYVTGLVGKWHLGELPQFHPQKRGFREFFGFLEGMHDYFRPAGILRGAEPAGKLDYTTDAFGREAVAFIERHRAEPWFLYLAFNAVHTPMQATDDRLAKFPGIADTQRRTYAAMTLALDEAVGKVRKKLADSGLEKNTLVVFFSDNGGPTMPGTTINGSRNTPLRGSKRTTLEGGIRVPFVISWPGRIKPGVDDRPVIQLDAHVTALAAAGVDVKPEWKLDGVNLLPFLSGEKAGAPHEALYWRLGQQMAIRVGDYKLVRYDSNADTRTGRSDQPVTAAKLYRLADDIGESRDLAAAMPEKVKELQSQWDAWNATQAAPLWGGGKAAGAKPGTRPKH